MGSLSRCAMTGQHGSTINFPGVSLDLVRELVHTGSGQIRLRPKSFAVFRYLAENPARIVDRDELIAAVWGHSEVADDSITQCLVEIRRALGSQRSLIKTIPKRGYLLDVSAPSPAALEPNAGFIRSRRRISWVIVGAVLAVIVLRLSVPAPGLKAVAAANTHVQQATYFYDQQTSSALDLARIEVDNALALNPDLAQAWVTSAKINVADSVRDSRRMTRFLTAARKNLERALQIDPGHAEAHIRLAQQLWINDNCEAAARHFRTARETDPTHPVVLSISAARAAWEGRLMIAEDLQSKAAELDPLSKGLRINLGTFRALAGDYPGAIEQFQLATDLSGEATSGDVTARADLALVLFLSGEAEKALQVFKSVPDSEMFRAARVLTHRAVGQADVANSIMEKLANSSSVIAAIEQAKIFAYQQQSDKAFEALSMASERMEQEREKTGVNHRNWRHTLRYNWFLRQLVDDPRWDQFFEGAECASIRMLDIPVAAR